MLFLNKKYAKSEGFTLIELCIAMTVIGVILVGVLIAYEQATREASRSSTRATLDNTLPKAFAEFVLKEGRYPCPANPALVSGQPGYGQEVPCAGAPAPVAGAIPTVALNIPEDAALDGWSRKFNYVVSPGLVTAPIEPNTPGILRVTNVGVEVVEDPVTGEQTQTGNFTTELDPDSFQVLIISYGDNGVGAFTASGIQTTACPTVAPLPREVENCNGDANFIRSEDLTNRFRIIGAQAEYYDDLVLAIQVPSLPIWMYSSENPNDVYTKVSRVGIGIRIPTAVLDVAGNIRTTRADTDMVCISGSDPLRCFNPKMIGGSLPSMDCESRPIIEIAEGSARCGETPFAGVPSYVCPGIQFAVGFDATGNIICE